MYICNGFHLLSLSLTMPGLDHLLNTYFTIISFAVSLNVTPRLP